VRVETLGRVHGNPMAAWRAMGSPPSPTLAQLDVLHAASAPRQEVLSADGDGRFVLDRVVDAWTVVLASEI
jgi:xylan 1,4-beta-xylosidase